MTERLEQAIVAVSSASKACAAGDFEAALKNALTAWELYRSASIADLIDAIDEAFLTDRDTVTARGTTKETFEATEQLGRQRDVRPLIEFVAGKLKTQPGAAALLPGLSASRGTDSRIAAALMALVHNPPFRSKAAELYKLIFSELVAQGDPRCVDEIRELSTHFRGKRNVARFLGRRGMPYLHETADKLVAIVPAPTTQALEAACEAARQTLESRRARPDNGAAAMLEAIYKDPHDLQLRMVYGDLLLEAGDPRGEFIALQCARARSSKRPSKRERQLERTHGRAWLGALEPVSLKAGVEFHGGFVRALQYRRVSANTDVIGHEHWSTVVEIGVSQWGRDIAELLLHPVMQTSLRVVTGLGFQSLHEILVSPVALPWTHLYPSLLLDRIVDAIARVGPLTSLESLDVSRHKTDLDALHVLLASPMGAQLERVRIQLEPSAWGRAMTVAAAASDRLKELEIVHFASSEGYTGWLCGFSRSANGNFDRLSLSYGRKRRGDIHGTIVAGLRSLAPDQLEHVVIEAPARVRRGDPDFVAAIENAATRFPDARFDFERD